MQFFASCPLGVADLTAAELRAAGATQTSEFKLGVQFEGSLEAAYRACLWSRTASRILMPLATFPVTSAEALYEGVKQTGRATSARARRSPSSSRARPRASRTRISVR